MFVAFFLVTKQFSLPKINTLNINNMDVINSKKCHKHIVKNWDVFSAIPEGWHIVPEATTIPNGYQLISNGQSLFSGKRETALIEYVHNGKVL